jgi:hypothetical protein
MNNTNDLMDQDYKMIVDVINEACDEYDIRIAKTYIDNYLKDHKHNASCSAMHLSLSAEWLKKKTELQIPLPATIL